MKTLVIIVLSSSILLLHNTVHAYGLKTDVLYKMCTSDKKGSEFALCLGFVAGVTSSAVEATDVARIALGGGYDDKTIKKASEASGKVFGCGEQHNLGETVDHFVSFIAKNPKFKSQTASFSLAYMMAKKYKCKG